MRRRKLVLVLSALWCVGGCIWVWLAFAAEPPTSRVVDRREEIGALLEGRRGAAGGERPAMLRVPLEPDMAEILFPSLASSMYEYDPLVYFKLKPGLELKRKFAEHPDGGWVIRSNARGMRDDEVRLEKPELRILVAGDSQTQGVCRSEETVPNELERRLAVERGAEHVEVLNAAAGGYGPWNYLGLIELHGDLEPDVFLVVVYGGNDFIDLMRLERYAQARGAPSKEPYDMVAMSKLLGDRNALMYSELSQLCYFLDNPEDVDIAVETLQAISLEIARMCEAQGAKPLFAYVPGPLSGQPGPYAEELEMVADATPLPLDELDLVRRMADAYVAFLAERELPCIDLRPVFAAADERLFWTADMHLNLAGNRVVAEQLEVGVRALLGE